MEAATGSTTIQERRWRTRCSRPAMLADSIRWCRLDLDLEKLVVEDVTAVTSANARERGVEEREVKTKGPPRGGRSPFFAIDADLEDHPKFHALIRARKWSDERGLAFAYRFLRTVRRHAADGDVTGWTDSYLGVQARVPRPSGLIEDLIAVGFLDWVGDRLIVHNWYERNGKWLQSKLSDEQRRHGGERRALTAKRNELGRFTPGESPGEPPGWAPGEGPGSSAEQCSAEQENVGAVAPRARPTLEEVRAYCMERGNAVDPELWMAHYKSNGWKVGKNPMKDWRASVDTWEKNGVAVSPKGANPRPKGPDPALMRAKKQREEWEREQARTENQEATPEPLGDENPAGAALDIGKRENVAQDAKGGGENA